MIQRGAIILIVGEALFIIGIIIAVVWAIQLASTVASAFQQERNTLINRVSIEPGSSVEAATAQVTNVSRPITVAIHIQRLGGREEAAAEGEGPLQQRLQQELQLPRGQREARLIANITDPSGTVVNTNEFSANLFTSYQPQNTGNYVLSITNAGAKNATIYGIFGYMPLLTAASSFVEGGQVSLPSFDLSLSTFSGVIVGGVLTAIGFITIMVGTMIVVIDGRKRKEHKSGGSSSSGDGGVGGEGGITYKKD